LLPNRKRLAFGGDPKTGHQARRQKERTQDASGAPRGQLPYIIDAGETIGDSDTVIAHLIAKHHLTMDAALTATERDLSHLITRMLDDLYWVMSYSRWKDERFWPAFRCSIAAASEPH
jgi:hypothetical protein